MGNKHHRDSPATPTFDKTSSGLDVNERVKPALHGLYGKEFGDDLTEADFETLRKLGEGAFGQVFLAKKRDSGKLYALKVLDKKAVQEMDAVEQIRAEEALMARAAKTANDLKFVVRQHYAFQTPTKLYIVQDYVPGGDLFVHLEKARRFSENRAKLYAAEMFVAVEHMHSVNIVFRDLKLENILMNSDGHVLITDFGLAKDLDALHRTRTVCGTPEYMPPEIMDKRQYTTIVDWWTFGVLIYVMIVGRYPFMGPSEAQAELRDQKNTIEYKVRHEEVDVPPFVGPEAADIIRQLLHKEEPRRLHGSKIKDHPWFAGIDWVRLEHKDYVAEFVPGDVETPQLTSERVLGFDWVNAPPGVGPRTLSRRKHKKRRSRVVTAAPAVAPPGVPRTPRATRLTGSMVAIPVTGKASPRCSQARSRNNSGSTEDGEPPEPASRPSSARGRPKPAAAGGKPKPTLSPEESSSGSYSSDPRAVSSQPKPLNHNQKRPSLPATARTAPPEPRSPRVAPTSRTNGKRTTRPSSAARSTPAPLPAEHSTSSHSTSYSMEPEKRPVVEKLSKSQPRKPASPVVKKPPPLLTVARGSDSDLLSSALSGSDR